MDRKFLSLSLSLCVCVCFPAPFLFLINVLFFLYECVGSRCTGTLIAPQQLAMMVILKREVVSALHFGKRVGANVSCSDASAIRVASVLHSLSICVFWIH